MKLYGKDALVTYFKTALRKHTLGHLYIFEGAVGMGKKTLCRYLAEMLLCERTDAPCGQCGSCIKTKSGNHPDIIYVETDEAKPFNVEKARALVAEMYVRPFLAERKIYILPAGETLSPAVQNTLLKAFEEPPPYVTIFLTVTNRDALLKTVLSRAIILPLPGCTATELETYIRDTFPHCASDAAFLAGSAGGSIGKAGQLAQDENFLSMRRALFAVLPRLASSRSGIYAVRKCFEENKDALPLLLSFFCAWMRDCVYVQLSDESALINRDMQAEISEFAFSVPPKAAIRCHDAATSLASTIGKGSNFTVWITDFLTECWRYCHDTDSRC
ncbi:MAG: hypothetical protein E7408_04435 [Ruminococcaceae bacterium]|nr:hypothetical protein [Oscillospiraceae bacterium]